MKRASILGGLVAMVGLSACVTTGGVDQGWVERQKALNDTASQADYQRVRSGTLPAGWSTKADAAIAATLKDPDSRKVKISPGNGGAFACAVVNARNSFGGYAGDTHNIVVFTGDQVDRVDTLTPDTARLRKDELSNTGSRDRWLARLAWDCGFISPF